MHVIVELFVKIPRISNSEGRAADWAGTGVARKVWKAEPQDLRHLRQIHGLRPCQPELDVKCPLAIVWDWVGRSPELPVRALRLNSHEGWAQRRFIPLGREFRFRSALKRTYTALGLQTEA